MAEGRAAPDPDRLPWLSDTRRRRGGRDLTPLMFWAFLAIVLVAGLAYWLGVRSVYQPDDFAEVLEPAAPVAGDPVRELTNQAIAALPPAPAPVEAPGLRDVALVSDTPAVAIPGVDRARPAEPVAAPEVKAEVAAAEPEKTEAGPEATAPDAPGTAVASAATAVKKPVAAATPRLQPWPADVSANAYGRVVRVGTFHSRLQAKQGWQRIVRVYPGMRRLRAVVVPNPSLRNGQMYYRLQFGTTSQAHSEILCQRMRIVAQSCVTVGLPASRGARG
jgi:hypothetical protein